MSVIGAILVVAMATGLRATNATPLARLASQTDSSLAMAQAISRLALRHSVRLTLTTGERVTGEVVEFRPQALTLREANTTLLREIRYQQLAPAKQSRHVLAWIIVSAAIVVTALLVKNCFYAC